MVTETCSYCTVQYIIITDGVPTDDPESVIVACARRLDQRNFPLAQIGIQFIQVGNDAEATEALEDCEYACLPACLLACLPACLPACLLACWM